MLAQLAHDGANVVEQLVCERDCSGDFLAATNLRVARQAREIELERRELVSRDVVQLARKLRALKSTIHASA